VTGAGARVVITGATGFAGRHLAAACEAAGDDVVAISRSAGADLLDAAAARAASRGAIPRARCATTSR
jgi:GDP-4-dehydro-6-deoxy-D-mannose reductase